MLCAPFTSVIVPLAVWSELTFDVDSPEPREVGAQPCVSLTPNISPPLITARLGAGEQQVIAHAMSHADAFAILDDRAARRAATRAGLRVTGTLTLIAIARQRGLCSSARDRVQTLLRSGFRADIAIVNVVLAQLGEPGL